MLTNRKITRDQNIAIPTKRQAMNIAGVARQCCDKMTVGQIPHEYTMIGTGGS